MSDLETNSASKILVFNIGSATFKWSVFSAFSASNSVTDGQKPIAEMESSLRNLVESETPAYCIVRFVHGGNHQSTPVFITEQNIASFEGLIGLAPVHNNVALDCVKALHAIGLESRVIAVFDTAFFRELPAVAQAYGLPHELTSQYGIRRFGFHGFAHASMFNSLRSIADKFPHQPQMLKRVITVQLGSGCSMAALLSGQPIETTMGFSPNEGLLMTTRSGDIDPGLVTWLQRKENWSPDQTDQVLNRESGLKGLTNTSGSMTEILMSDSARSRFAIELFVYRIRKTLGAYYALLGGLDSIVMSGGIAEHASPLCTRILKKLKHLGIDLLPKGASEDRSDNESYTSLHSQVSPVKCFVVTLNESREMIGAVNASGLVSDGRNTGFQSARKIKSVPNE